MTVVMKIDLVGPRRRGLALGFNESAGYLGVAATALLSGLLAGTVRTADGRLGRRRGDRGRRARGVRAVRARHCCPRCPRAGRPRRSRAQDPLLQAFRARLVPRARPAGVLAGGLVNNLNDALALGPRPPLPRRQRRERDGGGRRRCRVPGGLGTGQLGAGWLSDHIGRKPLIAAGMMVQGSRSRCSSAGGGDFAPSLGQRRARRRHGARSTRRHRGGLGTRPAARPCAGGRHRPLLAATSASSRAAVAGIVADAAGIGSGDRRGGGVTAASGVWVTATRWHGPPVVPAANAP